MVVDGNCTLTDLTAEINGTNTSLTQSVQDIEIKYDTTTDKPMYRERGADTWLPFSGYEVIYGAVSNSTPFTYTIQSDCTCDAMVMYYDYRYVPVLTINNVAQTLTNKTPTATSDSVVMSSGKLSLNSGDIVKFTIPTTNAMAVMLLLS